MSKNRQMGNTRNGAGSLVGATGRSPLQRWMLPCVLCFRFVVVAGNNVFRQFSRRLAYVEFSNDDFGDEARLILTQEFDLAVCPADHDVDFSDAFIQVFDDCDLFGMGR